MNLYTTTSADPDSPALLAVVTDDGHGWLIGERAEAEALHTALDFWLATGATAGEIDELDPIFGWQWLSISEAVEYAAALGRPVAAPTIRKAAADGQIGGARLDGKTWRFARPRFLGWLGKRR